MKKQSIKLMLLIGLLMIAGVLNAETPTPLPVVITAEDPYAVSTTSTSTTANCDFTNYFYKTNKTVNLAIYATYTKGDEASYTIKLGGSDDKTAGTYYYATNDNDTIATETKTLNASGIYQFTIPCPNQSYYLRLRIDTAGTTGTQGTISVKAKYE